MEIDLTGTLEYLLTLGTALIGTLLIVIIVAAICYGTFRLYRKLEGKQ